MSFPRSDHCNGKTFFYPGGRAERGPSEVLRWKLTSRPTPWPQWVDYTLPSAPPASFPGQITATWIGHATFLLQTPHGNFLTDPVFSDRCSPFSWLGPHRVHAPGLAFEALPKIDGVLLSHDHYDHFDLPSLRRLARTHDPVILAPLGHRQLLANRGISRVIELDWWETHAWAPDLTVTLTPSKHWCRRLPGDTNHRLWGGFWLSGLGRNVYFLGDSGYDPNLFVEIGRKMGRPDLAFIPIGAYEPHWFMCSAHMNPAEALQVHRDLGAHQSVAMHWGTWQLTDEGRDEPVRDLVQAQALANVAPQAFRVLDPGQSLSV